MGFLEMSFFKKEEKKAGTKEEKIKFYFIVHVWKKKRLHKGVPFSLKSCRCAVTDSLLMTGEDFQQIQRFLLNNKMQK